MKAFFVGVWTRIKAICVEVETKIKDVWNMSWELVKTAYATAQKLILSLGEIHVALIIAAAWIVYFLFAKGLLTVSTNVVAALLLSLPYLVGAVLLAATVLLVVDIINKKK